MIINAAWNFGDHLTSRSKQNAGPSVFKLLTPVKMNLIDSKTKSKINIWQITLHTAFSCGLKTLISVDLVMVPATYEQHSFPPLVGTFSGGCLLMAGTERRGKFDSSCLVPRAR